MSRVLALLASLFLMTPGPGGAGANDIVYLEIDGLHQANADGVYDRLMLEAQKRGFMASTLVASPARAFVEFESGRVTCISPANKNPLFYDFDFPVVASSNMSVARVYIFAPPGKPAFSDIIQLEGLRVGARTGMPYGKTVETAGLNLFLSQSLESNIKKLKAGRLDALIAYDPDIFTALENMGEDPFPYFRNLPVAVHPDQVLCRDTPKGRLLVKSLNAAFRAMHKDGTFAQTLGEN